MVASRMLGVYRRTAIAVPQHTGSQGLNCFSLPPLVETTSRKHYWCRCMHMCNFPSFQKEGGCLGCSASFVPRENPKRCKVTL